MAPLAQLPSFSERLLQWFDLHGRHDLPWQHPRTPYRVWVAEVMLQQTQVKTVIPYFQRFIARFPDLPSLAASSLDDVLQHWAGLGYYARGRNLHRAARLAMAEHGGELPKDFDALLGLPGLGRSTASAILAQAHGARHAILDGNVKRVLARHAAVAGWPGEPRVAARLWEISESLLPQSRLADFTQAMMDLGASLCTSRAPACARCPVNQDCVARLSDCVEQFPASRPKRLRPLRHAVLLLVENDIGEILLERRPPAGIWGGLWCTPMIDAGEDAAKVLAARYAIAVESFTALPVLRHAFTHFELEMQPLLAHAVSLSAAKVHVREATDVRWVRIKDEPPALPAPISKLLFRLQALQGPPCPEPSAA